MYHNSVQYGDQATITLIGSTIQTVVSDAHPKYPAIARYFENTPADQHDEAYVSRLLDAETTVGLHLQALSDRVSYANGRLFFDGDPVKDALSDRVIEQIRAEEPVESLVNFLENVSANPDPVVRAELFSWLDFEDFTLTPEGNVVGYKSVQAADHDPDTGEVVEVDNLSWSQGTTEVFVDGESVTGRVPYRLGSVVQIPRSQADQDRRAECGYGLHVGTWGYASTFHASHPGAVILTVEFNPRDVVGLPEGHSGYGKVRVCRLVPTAVTDHKLTDRVIGESTEADPFEDPFYDEEEEVESPFDEALKPGISPVVQAQREGQPLETVADYAAADPEYKRALEDTSLGHKPLARQYPQYGSEASVRRYRKAQGITLSLGARVRDAVS